LFINLYTI